MACREYTIQKMSNWTTIEKWNKPAQEEVPLRPFRSLLTPPSQTELLLLTLNTVDECYLFLFYLWIETQVCLHLASALHCLWSIWFWKTKTLVLSREQFRLSLFFKLRYNLHTVKGSHGRGTVWSVLTKEWPTPPINMCNLSIHPLRTVLHAPSLSGVRCFCLFFVVF